MRLGRCVVGTISLCLVLLGMACAQNHRLDWSSFNMSYGGPVSGNTMVRAVAGQNFAGLTWQSNTRIVSGFLGAVLGDPQVVAVDDRTDVPLTYALSQNYPNPFNPTTMIRFEIPAEVHVALKVYNVLGQEVLVVVDEVKQPGRYEVRVDASVLASGAYLYRLRAGDFVETRKFILLR